MSLLQQRHRPGVLVDTGARKDNEPATEEFDACRLSLAACPAGRFERYKPIEDVQYLAGGVGMTTVKEPLP